MLSSKEKTKIALMCFNAIFISKQRGSDITQVQVRHPNIANGAVNGRWFRDSSTGQQTLRGFDLDIRDGQKLYKLRMLEQNPNKLNTQGQLKPMAAAARAGTKIMWIIDRSVQGGFLSRIQDGKLVKFQEPAYSQNRNAVAKSSTSAPPPAPPQEPVEPDLDNLPNVQRLEDIPGLIESIANAGFDE